MKKHKLRKLIEETISEYKKNDTKTDNLFLPTDPYIHHEPFMNEYDDEVSENFYKFAIRAAKSTDKFTTFTTTERMTISGYFNSETIELIIHKTGFRINKFNQSGGIFTIGSHAPKQTSILSYKDDQMFDRLSTFLNSIRKESQREAFLNEIDEICIATKLSRESNLEELLNEENNDDVC